MDARQPACQVLKTIKIFCPYCGATVEIPMCQAMNGEEIECLECHKIFDFRDGITC